MACRQTGFAMLASGSVQEVMDLGGSCTSWQQSKSRVPFLHFFDGFRTSHEVQKIEVIEYEDFEKLLDKEALNEFRNNALNPEHPVTKRNCSESGYILPGKRSLQTSYYDAVPEIVEDYMKEISKITGREYSLFNYYGAPDAENIIIAMGSVCETIEETLII